MRMRADVDALAGQELDRPHLVEEDERPDHLALRDGQHAADLEAAEVAGTRHDHGLDRVAGGGGAVVGDGAGLPAHDDCLRLRSDRRTVRPPWCSWMSMVRSLPKATIARKGPCAKWQWRGATLPC